MLFLYISKTKHNETHAGQTNELIPTTLYQRPSCLALLLTIGRGATLPFMTIYLSASTA